MNYLFCRTCETFGKVGDGALAGRHAGHIGTVVAHDDPNIDIARLFAGWLRIQRELSDGTEIDACPDPQCEGPRDHGAARDCRAAGADDGD